MDLSALVKKHAKSKLVLFLWVVMPFTIVAQNHYWSQQYGAAATLSGGAEIAGVRDNTALFYNPGAMGMIESNKISISANVYEAQVVTLKNVAGKDIDARSFRALIYPQFIGGSFYVKKVPKLKIMYGTLVRNRSSLRYNATHETYTDAIPGSPGLEYYKARLEYEFNSTETWAGLGFGYRLNNNFSAGVSVFGSYTNLETITALSAGADGVFGITPYTATVNDYGSVKIDHINFIAKAGIAAEFPRLRLGLAITMPSAKIWGQGNMTKTFELHNLNLYAEDTTAIVFKYPSLLVSDEQKNLKSQYKQPASFALGAEYKWKRVKVKLATEIFLGMPQYEVLRGVDEAFIRPANAYGGQTLKDFMVVKSRAAPVVNISIGGTFRIKNKFKVLTGFRTDFNNRMNFGTSQYDSRLGSITPPNWHLLHFSAGASYYRGASDITLGFSYSFGIAADRKSAVNLNDPKQNLLLRSTPENVMRTNVTNFGLIVGYTYYFRGNPRASEKIDTEMLEDW